MENRFVKDYLNDLGPLKQLSFEEERELIVKHIKGNERAYRDLALKNQYIVIKEAIRAANEPFEMMDLIQFANLALLKALDKDKIQIDGFKSYLHRNIYRGLQNEILNNFSFIRYPQNRIYNLTNFNKYYIENELDLQSYIHYSKELINKVKQINADKKFVHSEFDNVQLRLKYSLMIYYRYDDFKTDQISYEHFLDKKDHENSIRFELNNILETLQEREKQIIQLYYGIGVEYPIVLSEIGEYFNVTRERVRQIKEKAIERLRHSQRKKNLSSLWEDFRYSKDELDLNNSLNGYLLDPYCNFYINNRDSKNILENYIKTTTRKEFVSGVKNLAQHYRNILKSFFEDLGHITLIKKAIQHIKNIDDGMFNSSIFDYSIHTSESIKRVNDYIGLIEHFDEFD